MADFRQVSDIFAVSPQLSEEDVRAAAEAGFRLIINNRPDGEAPDQPASARLEAAARAAGLAYAHIPVVGRPSGEAAQRMGEVLDGAGGGKALAFCRSGTRSIMAWAMAEQAAGRRTRAELLEAGARAGYELSSVLSADPAAR